MWLYKGECEEGGLLAWEMFLKKDPNKQKLKRMLFSMTKHNRRILGMTPFFKLQNNTWTVKNVM